jgi:MFS family permease
MMTSLCTEYYQFVLAQGILGGFSVGMIFTPIMSVPNHYFRRKIGIALGTIVAGSSVGGVVFPITLNRLLNSSSIGFGWTVRTCGFIIAASLGITCATVKARLHHTGQAPGSKSFKRPLYYLTVVAVFFMTWGIFVPYFYLASSSTQHGMGVELASYLVAILNAASFFGRVVPGLAADMLGRYNMTCLAAVCSGILLLCWQQMTSNAAIVAFAALYGFFSGAIISLGNACIAQITPNPRHIGAHVGMLMFVNSFAGLSGPPISGALVARYGSYDQSGYFAGASVLVGATILFATRFVGERDFRKPF